MRCKSFVATLALASVALASTAWAFPPSNPYLPPPSQIQGSLNRTGDFSGGTQASTGVASNIPLGIKVTAVWSTGAPFANETFTRLVYTQQYPTGGDGDRGDLDAFDGVSWVVTSDVALAIKPYSQTGTNFSFREGNQADAGCGVGTICVPGGNVPTLVRIDWDDLGGGAFPNGSPGGRDDMFEHGFQVFGPSPPQDGTTVTSVFTITNVPEPSAIMLSSFGVVALIGLARRSRQK